MPDPNDHKPGRNPGRNMLLFALWAMASVVVAAVVEDQGIRIAFGIIAVLAILAMVRFAAGRKAGGEAAASDPASDRRSLQLSAAVENTASGILITDPNLPGNPIVFVNPAFAAMTGYSAQELVGGGGRFLEEHDADTASAETIHRAFNERHPVSLEVPLQRRDGSQFWSQVTVGPVFDDGGRLINFVVVVADVSEYKATAETLERARHDLEVAEAANRAKSEFLAAMSRELRAPLNTIIGYAEMMLSSMPAPLDRREHREYVNAIIEAGRDLLDIVNSSLDVLRIESTLQTGESGYRQLVDLAPDLICVCRGSTIALINSVGATMLGSWNPGVLIGHAFREYVSPAFRHLVDDGFKRLLAHGPRVEMTMVREDGGELVMEATARAIRFENGDAIMIVARDVTEYRRAEQKIRDLAKFPDQDPNPVMRVARDGLLLYSNAPSAPLVEFWHCRIGGRLPESVREMIVEVLASGEPREIEIRCDGQVFSLILAPIIDSDYVNIYGRDVTKAKSVEAQLRHAQKMEAIGTLAGGIAHDFNNILSAIIGYAHLMEDEVADGDPIGTDVEHILNAAHRAKNLVSQILTFSRRREVERLPVNVALMTKEVLQLIRATIPATTEFRSEVDPACGMVMADPTHIHQLLMNLCTNAADAIGDDPGVIQVTVREVQLDAGEAGRLGLLGGRYVELSVKDTGCGMTPAIIERIFEPFFTTKDVGSGTGMGLAVAHGIVTDLGGAIQVASVPGKGSTFTILLPVAEETERKPVLAPEDVPVAGDEHILMVDDEEAIADVVGKVLRRLGYSVDTFTSSFAALARFRNAPEAFDLVITDQTMPMLTGRALADRMRALRPDIPVILCSGFANTDDEAGFKAAGINEFIRKPLDIHDLPRIVRRVLDEAAARE